MLCCFQVTSRHIYPLNGLSKPLSKDTVYLDTGLAETFNLKNFSQVCVRTDLPKEGLGLDSLELVFRDQYMGRYVKREGDVMSKDLEVLTLRILDGVVPYLVRLLLQKFLPSCTDCRPRNPLSCPAMRGILDINRGVSVLDN